MELLKQCKHVAMGLGIAAALSLAVGCEKDAGDHLDDARDDIQDAADSVQDAGREAADDIGDAIDD